MSVQLRSIAEVIFSGLSAYGRSPIRDSGIKIHMITIKNLQDGQLLTQELTPLTVSDQNKIKRYQVYPGDLLISSKGTSFKTALVPNDLLMNTIISSNICAVRLKHNSFPPVLLQAFFEAPIGQAALLAQSQGSNVLSLRPQSLAEIQIPIPPPEQTEALTQLVESFFLYGKFAKNAIEQRQKIVQSIIQQSFEKAVS